MHIRAAGEYRAATTLALPLPLAASRQPTVSPCPFPLSNPSAAPYAGGWQGQGQTQTMKQHKKEKDSMGARILAGVLSLSSAPYRQVGGAKTTHLAS